jgi:hypothetical protein
MLLLIEWESTAKLRELRDEVMKLKAQWAPKKL